MKNSEKIDKSPQKRRGKTEIKGKNEAKNTTKSKQHAHKNCYKNKGQKNLTRKIPTTKSDRENPQKKRQKGHN